MIVDNLKYTLQLDSSGFSSSAKSADQQVNKLSKSIGTSLANAIKGAVSAYMLWKGLNMAGQLIQEGAQAERVGQAWENLAKSIGLNGQAMLAELKTQSANTISEIDLMVQASSASIMGLPMEQLPQLMKISRAAAQAFGKDTSFMFQSIVLGIARQSRLILDNLGIIINQEELYEAETKRLGHALSDAEKKQAFFNEALKQGQNILDRVNPSINDMATNIERFTASMKDLRAEAGKTLISLADITEGANLLFTTLDGGKAIMKSIQDLDFWERFELFGAFVGAITGESGGFLKILDHIREYNDELRQADLHVKSYRDSFGEMADEHVKSYLKMLEPIEEWIAAMDALKKSDADVFGKFQKSLRKINDLLREQAGTLKTIKEEIETMPSYWGIPLPGTLPGSTTQLLPGYQGPPTEQITAWQSFWEDIQSAIGEDGRNLLEGAFEGILNELNSFAAGIFDIGADIASGNFYGAGGKIVSWISGAFSSTDNMREVLAAYGDEVDRNIELIQRLTDLERELRLAELERLQQFYEVLASLGGQMAETFQGIADELQREIDAILGSIADAETIRGIESFQQLLDYIAGTPDLDFQVARNLINHFINMFDLTTEQQIELWQILYDMLEASGNWTLDQQWWLEETIRGLQELAESVAEVRNISALEVGGAGIGDQVYRSITTITRTQANAMQAILNSIHFDTSALVQIAGQIAASLSGAIAPVISGGVVIEGGVHITGGGPRQMADAFVAELRAQGIKVA